jgi:hypothetical protein
MVSIAVVNSSVGINSHKKIRESLGWFKTENGTNPGNLSSIWLLR